MGDDGLLVVDNSILAATAKCHTYAYVRYALGLNTREESLALAAGSAYHLGLKSWLDGDGVKQALRVMADSYEAKVDSYLRKVERDRLGADDRRFEPEWVEAIFHQYLTENDRKFPFKVVGGTMEKPIAAPFPMRNLESGKEVLYVARLDAVVRKWESGGRWSMDHKSTKRATEWWIEKEKISSQFSGQMWLAQQPALRDFLGTDTSFQGVVLNVIEIPDPHKSEQTCRDHKVSYQECSVRHAGSTFVYVQRSKPEMEGWLWTARKLTREYDRLVTLAKADGIAGIPNVQMQGRFNQGCVFCSQREWCRLGRNTSKAAQRITFIDDPWDPRREQE